MTDSGLILEMANIALNKLDPLMTVTRKNQGKHKSGSMTKSLPAPVVEFQKREYMVLNAPILDATLCIF